MKGSVLNMKHLLKLILVAVGIFLAAESFTLLNQAAGDHSATVAPSAGVAPSTETLYKQKCSKCHGADGSGDTSLGKVFGAPDFTDPSWRAKHPNSSEHVSVIARGKKNMPAFGKKLTRAQIAGLAAYTQRFK
jgi:mono/diheme cytochrome c family protein